MGDFKANTFRSATYKETVSSEPIMLYRSYGGQASEKGGYWTRTKPLGPLQSMIDGAIHPSWGNTLEKTVQIELPPGTIFYEGVSAPQKGLLGGGNQIYIENVQKSWIKK